MSLGRLLTSGKSLVTFRNAAGHYQMRPSKLLPKFGSAKNPFLSSTQQMAHTDSSALLKEHGETVVNQTTAAAPEKKNFVAEDSLRTSSTPAKQAHNRWLKKLNPAGWWKRSPSTKPAIPKFNKAPIQGELSLDRVKVVRNDLSEADVEVVVTRPNIKLKTPIARAETTAAELVRT